MKKYLPTQTGLTLLEVLIGITLMLLLLFCMLNLFSSSLNLWTSDKNHTNIEQNARIAIDTMLREIRYACKINFKTSSSLTITKLDGEMNTFQLGGGVHSKTLYILIDKSKATSGGGRSSNPITENVVTSLQFTPYPERGAKAVIIAIEVTDMATGKTQIIHTAISPWNIQ